MIGPALDDLDLTAVFAAFRDQEQHGHTAESDADRKLPCFGEDLIKRSIELRDVLIPGDRQNLDVGYRRAARLAAYAVAAMRRIRTEQRRRADNNRSTDQ
jgi:hypothetical protein